MPSKTEKEKMLAGERYNFLDPGLEIERQEAKKLLRLYNLTKIRLNDKPSSGKCWEPSVRIQPSGRLSTARMASYLGDYVFPNYMCAILDNNEVLIGNHVMIGPTVQIYTAAHDLQAKTRIQGWEVARPIVIEDNVW